jgi:hypothetical protein
MNTNLITDDTKKILADSATLENLNPEQQQRLDQLVDNLLQRVFTRVSYALTDEDIQKIDEIDKEDQNGQAVKYFLQSKVPNFDAIVEEEVSKLKEEVTQS